MSSTHWNSHFIKKKCQYFIWYMNSNILSITLLGSPIQFQKELLRNFLIKTRLAQPPHNFTEFDLWKWKSFAELLMAAKTLKNGEEFANLEKTNENNCGMGVA